MAIEYNQLGDGEGLEIMYSGILYGVDIMFYQSQYSAKDRVTGKLKYRILDYTFVERSYVSIEELDMISYRDKLFYDNNPDLVTVFVAPNALFFALAGVWEAHLESYSSNIKRFSYRAEAQEWLQNQLSKNEPT